MILQADYIIYRTRKVINSCTTLTQLDMASDYCSRLVYKYHMTTTDMYPLSLHEFVVMTLKLRRCKVLNNIKPLCGE